MLKVFCRLLYRGSQAKSNRSLSLSNGPKNIVQHLIRIVMSDFKFPPSVQSDLFNYLKPEQQEFVRPVLRILKKGAQEELCIALLDYLETGNPEPPASVQLGAFFMYLTRVGMEDQPSYENDTKILRPLHRTEPKGTCGEHCRTIGTFMKQLKRKYFPNARPLEQSAGYQAMQKV